SGDSYECIRRFLDELDRYWLPSDLDAGTVGDRERRGIAMPAAFLLPFNMLAQLVEALPPGTYSVGSALAKLHDQEFRDRAPGLLRHPELFAELERNRQRHERGEKLVPLNEPRNTVMWIQAS